MRQLPAEFRRPEALEIPISELAAEQQNQAAVADEQRKVVPVHFYIEIPKKKQSTNPIFFILMTVLTVVIGVAEEVLLDVFALACVVFVLHPVRQREVLRQVVRHHFRRNLNAC